MNIDNLTIKGFKKFKEPQEFALRPITLVVGPNNSGKSSFSSFLKIFKTEYESFASSVNKRTKRKIYNLKIDEYFSPSNQLLNNEGNQFFEASFILDKDIGIELLVKNKFYCSSNREINLGEALLFHNGDKIFEMGDHLTFIHFSKIKKLLESEDLFFKYFKLNQEDPWSYLIFKNENKVVYSIEELKNKHLNHPTVFFDILGVFSCIPSNNIKISNTSDLNIFFNKIETYILKENKSAFYDDTDVGRIIGNFFDNKLSLGTLERSLNENQYSKDFNLNFINKNLHWDDLLKFYKEYGFEKFEFWLKFIPTLISSRLFELFHLEVNNFNPYNFSLKNNITPDNEFYYVLNEFWVNRKKGITIYSNTSPKGGDIPYERIINKILEPILKGRKLLIEKDGEVFQIYIENKKTKENIFNQGKGFQRILLIVLNMLRNVFMEQEDIRESFGRLLLEEPEVGLHPKFQSILPDIFSFFYKNSGFDHSLVIETHSEYLIRKYQLLVAKGKIEPKDIVINYLGENQKDSKIINFNPDGTLDKEFGPGFYDEAQNMMFDLLKFKN